MKYAVLLRGINVGGHNKIPMADLKSSLTKTGYVDPVTYLQSGNVVLDSETPVEATEIADLISADFGLTIPVVVQTKSQIAAAIRNNPFTKFEPKRLHVMYMDKSVPASKADKLDIAPYKPDQVRVKGRHTYVLYKQDSWSSKATIEVPEKAFGVTATARNWNTATKLLELVS